MLRPSWLLLLVPPSLNPHLSQVVLLRLVVTEVHLVVGGGLGVGAAARPATAVLQRMT